MGQKHIKQKYYILASTSCVYSVRGITAGTRRDSIKEIIKDWLPAKNRDENHSAMAAKSDLHFYNYDNELEPG